MHSVWGRFLGSTLLLATVVGALTTGCVVAAGDDDGWRRDRSRWHERRDDDRRDGRWDYRRDRY
jgi:hypothetical protein